jgi:hypothetical protein
VVKATGSSDARRAFANDGFGSSCGEWAIRPRSNKRHFRMADREFDLRIAW